MIESHYFWQNISILALGTLAIRGSIIAISARVKISNEIKEIFSFIPAAILPAFIVPSAFFHEGHAEWVFGKERFLILALAAVVCYVSHSMLATIVFGLATLYVISLMT